MGDSYQLTEYFCTLKEHLKCPRHRQSQFLSNIKDMIADFRQGNPSATEAEIINFLGEPQDLARTYLDTLDPQELKHYRRRALWIRRGCACAVATVIVVLAAWCCYLETRPGEFTVVETITIYSSGERT